MSRPKVPEGIQTSILVASRRRCAFCFGLNHNLDIKQGQIAHVDHNSHNNRIDNLVWLCLDHHDQYDSRTSQSKGLAANELKIYRDDLYSFNTAARARLEPNRPHTDLSPEAARLGRYLNELSKNGYKFDPQVRIETLPGRMSATEEDVEFAVDKLCDLGLIELDGEGTSVFPVDRFFWETDALFSDSDPVLDAQIVAKFMVAHDNERVNLSAIAVDLGWSPRRLNPACMYLVESGLVNSRAGLGSAPHPIFSISLTTKTKRFVKNLAA